MTRVVGICSHCGSDLIRSAVQGELASCLCGLSSINEAVLDTAVRMNPLRVAAKPDEGELTR